MGVERNEDDGAVVSTNVRRWKGSYGVGGGEMMLQCVSITHHDAKPFITKWHYSHCIPTGHNVFFGWLDACNELYAVANYGWGVNPHQEKFLTRITGLDVRRDNCLELKRLCRREPALQSAPLTQFLSACHRLLRRDDIKYIVSFSDPEYGHTGGIYKAASFEYLGKTNPERHVVDEHGQKTHRRVAYRHSRRHHQSIAKSRADLGLTPVTTAPKDRWFKVISGLRRKCQRRHSGLPVRKDGFDSHTPLLGGVMVDITKWDFSCLDMTHKNFIKAVVFIEKNPHIVTTIVETAMHMKYVQMKDGWAIQAGMELLRYDPDTHTIHPGEPYKIGHNHRSFIARLIMHNVPELEGFFEIREVNGKKVVFTKHNKEEK